MISSFTINGVSVDNTNGYHIVKATGFAAPPVRISSYHVSGKHESKIPNALWAGRNISFEIIVVGTTISDYATKRVNLLKAFDLPRDGIAPLDFSTNDGKNLSVNVQVQSIVGDFEPGRPNNGNILIQLLTEDSLIYSQGENIQEIVLPLAGGHALPHALPFSYGASSGGSGVINNAGNGPVYPTIRFAGPLTNMSITNSTTGKSLTINTTLTSAQSITVDMKNQTATFGDGSNALPFISVGSEFWFLEPGNNTIQFNSSIYDASARARVTWNDAYLGI